MTRRHRLHPLALVAAAALFAATALPGVAQDTGASHSQAVLIRNATVHTAGAQGTLQNADVLVQGGIIRAVGTGLAAPAGATTVDAAGKPLTPAFFGGITDIGLEEVSGEESTVDGELSLEEQPEPPVFDVSLA